MNKNQKLLLSMLKEIDSICRNNGIHYYLIGGSLLGAIRNKGFLPWDDDADIAMPYDDYLRFREVCKTQLPPNRAFCSTETHEGYNIVFPRYVATDTTAIHKAQSLHDDIAGEVIDVFPLDPVSEDPALRREYEKRVSIEFDIANYSSDCCPRYEIAYEDFRHYADLLEQRGKKYVCQLLNHERAKCFDPDGKVFCVRWQGCMIEYPRSCFSDTVEVPFEDGLFYAPIGANEVLTKTYGVEWAQLPQRVNPAKHETASSLIVPYNEALGFYAPVKDRSALLRDQRRHKDLVLQNAKITSRLNGDITQAKVATHSYAIAKRMKNPEVSSQFYDALHRRDAQLLYAILKDLIDAQTDAHMIGRKAYHGVYRYRNPILIPTSDAIFEGEVIALAFTGHFSYAIRLLEIRQNQGLPMTPTMLQIKQAGELLNQSTNLYEQGKYTEGLEIAREAKKMFPCQDIFVQLECVLLRKIALSDDDEISDENAMQAFIEAVKVGEQNFPYNGFYIKMRGDILYARGDKTTARDAYLIAAEHTRNGFCLTDIAEKTGYYPRWMSESKWGETYGINAWNDKYPTDNVPSCPEPDPKMPPLDPSMYLYELLKELCELCGSLSIPYVLSSNAANALIGYGKKPDAIANYAIAIDKQDAQQLESGIAQYREAGHQRICEHKLPGKTSEELRFHGEDSLYVRMGSATKPDPDYSSLYVSIALSETKLPPCKKRKDGVNGYVFNISKTFKKRGGAPKSSMVFAFGDIVSTNVTFNEFASLNPIPKDYFSRKREFRKTAKEIKALQRSFLDNMDRIVAAVRLKEVAVLLAENEELIRKGVEEEDVSTITSIYSPYIKELNNMSDRYNIKLTGIFADAQSMVQ